MLYISNANLQHHGSAGQAFFLIDGGAEDSVPTATVLMTSVANKQSLILQRRSAQEGSMRF